MESNKKTYNKGYSLVELLIALSLSSILSIGIIKEIHHNRDKEKRIKQKRKIKIIKEKVNAHISPYLNQMGTWHAFSNFKITEESDFAEINNNINGKAFSVINFETSAYYLKKENQEYCLIGSNFNKKKFNALVFTESHWQEAAIELKSNASCSEIKNIAYYNSPFNLEPNNTPENSPENNADLAEQLILLPIKASFSIFLDNQNTIRKLNHHNNHSQPIEYQVNKFLIKNDLSIELEYKESLKIEYTNYTTSPLELFAILYGT